jgi:hypothetical protein
MDRKSPHEKFNHILGKPFKVSLHAFVHLSISKCPSNVTNLLKMGGFKAVQRAYWLEDDQVEVCFVTKTEPEVKQGFAA